ncbi:MAG TPA: DNA translocase FtsK [Bacillota bacterium]|nr:DNA translocase FtsK [Bacillota bacterium]
MTKKKKRKKQRLKNNVKFELIGILLIFIAILGSGVAPLDEGFIPGGLVFLFRFFLGMWYFLASLTLLTFGLFLLIKRRLPNFYDKKFIGILIFILGLLLLTHIQLFERLVVEDVSILKFTWHQLTNAETISQFGGGIIGGMLLACCYYLFSLVGTKIVAVFSMLIGIAFIANASLGEMFIKIVHALKLLIKKSKATAQQNKRTKQKRVKEEPVVLEMDERPINDEQLVIHEFSHKSPVTEENNDSENISDVADEQFISLDKIRDENQTSFDYQLPSIDLLNRNEKGSQKYERSHIQSTIKKLEQTFQSFGVNVRVNQVHVGPAVTKYELTPEAGVKVSRIVSLHDDLALALAAKDIRIEAPIPGKSAVGIEVPNKDIAVVSFREVIEATSNQPNKLLFALGRDISGHTIVGALNKMPHLLIAGATGSGKSVCINSIIATILMRAKPNEVKMMMIDPKKVELNVYNGIPHLLAPVVTDPKKASMALMKVVAEMERRYELFSETGTRNIEAYNEQVEQYNEVVSEEEHHAPLPYIVVIVDELADLMMVASKDVEDSITRLAQMARAAGIHLIIATQRPSVDVITGVIKANIPSRIAFSVSSQTDSRTIIDTGGAEKLLGRGDMLYMPVGMSKPIRVQGAFLSDEEVQRIVEHCTNEQKASYDEEMIPNKETEQLTDVDDELYEDAVNLIIDIQSASVSMLQRRFRIGYTRAARLIDAMEERGIVGPYEGNRPRTVLVSKQEEEKSS